MTDLDKINKLYEENKALKKRLESIEKSDVDFEKVHKQMEKNIKALQDTMFEYTFLNGVKKRFLIRYKIHEFWLKIKFKVFKRI